MRNVDIEALISKYPVVSDQIEKNELRVILRELSRSLSGCTSGSVVEFGCFVGTASLFIRRVIDMTASEVAFHVYDSFEGLPEKTASDLSPAGLQFVPGSLTASRKEFTFNFKKAGLQLPRIHKGWFSQLTEADVPNRIAFAFLDGDYYRSIADSLHLITPKLLPGATIVVDDYANEALPGTTRAVDEWMTGRPASLRVEATLAIIRMR